MTGNQENLVRRLRLIDVYTVDSNETDYPDGTIVGYSATNVDEVTVIQPTGEVYFSQDAGRHFDRIVI